MVGHKDYQGADRFVPGGRAGLATVARAARTCQGCDLHERATQTVFGQGAAKAEVVLIGEQPGDAEDRAGAPFVGPAGKLLDRALADAGRLAGRGPGRGLRRAGQRSVRGRSSTAGRPSRLRAGARATRITPATSATMPAA